MFCPNCGLETFGKFCPNCGIRLPAAKSVVSAKTEAAVKEAETVVSAEPEAAVKEAEAALFPEPEEVKKEAEPVVSAEPEEVRKEAGTVVFSEPEAMGKEAGTVLSPETESLVKEAETVAAAVSAVIAADAGPAPIPEQPGPDQAPLPDPTAPEQTYAAWPSAPDQGYVPNQAAPNQGYLPNQAMPDQGYAPNQVMPNQSYAPNQAYAPQPGVAPSADVHRAPSTPEAGETPATRLVRKLAGSGVWIVAAMTVTFAFLLNLGYFIYTIAEQRQYVLDNYIAASLPGILISFFFALLLWIVFGSAVSKRNQRMGSGALTTLKVIFIICLILACLALVFDLILGGLLVFLGSRLGNMSDYSEAIEEGLQQFNGDLSGLEISFPVLCGVFFGLLALILLFAIIYYAKVVKSLSTARRVLRTGVPDDRVSVFVGVFTILGALCMGMAGVALLFLTGMPKLLTTANVRIDSTGILVNGIACLLNAVSAFCFAVVLFKFRSGVRRLGVRRGVMQRPMQ